MSFGCYTPDVNTSLGCRQTTANMGFMDQRMMSEKIQRESRNPITGEVVSYSQQKSSIYDKEKGFAGPENTEADKFARKVCVYLVSLAHAYDAFAVQVVYGAVI